jgi:hypothetical protein
MTHVYDQFRIYDETPTSFGALEDVSPSWRDSSPETVLRADFNGPGNGTGGDNDIVTLGGTATLVDAGIYSDASVFESDPFKTSGINESVVTDGLTTGSFNFGKILGYGEVPSVQDFDCLRVYKDTPLVLSALPVPTSGTIILVQ